MIPSPMFKKITLLLFFSLSSVIVISQDLIESRYNELLLLNDCHSKPCALRLKDHNDNWKLPSSHALKFVRDNKISILKYAKLYNVSPEAIAAVFVAEGSVNFYIDDKIQDLLSRLVGEKVVMYLGKLIGLNISLGPAQINEQGILQAIQTIRTVEKKNISLEKLKEEIMGGNNNPYWLISPTIMIIGSMINNSSVGSIRIVAALLYKAQKDYQKAGIDISKNMGALITLYNLGSTQEKAQSIDCSENYIPKINFLGLFAEKYKTTIIQSIQ